MTIKIFFSVLPCLFITVALTVSPDSFCQNFQKQKTQVNTAKNFISKQQFQLVEPNLTNFDINHSLNLNFVTYSEEDGLTSNGINQITQDKNGFLWIATSNGLCRYDGYSFNNFKPKTTDTTAILKNFISCLLADNNGVIWFGTFNGRIGYINPLTDSLNVVDTPFLDPSEHEPIIKCLLQIDNSILLVGVHKKGIFKYNIKLRKLDKLLDFPGQIISDIKQETADLFWVTTNKGLFYFRISEKQVYQIKCENGYRGFYNLIFDHTGGIWMSSYAFGLCYYNRITKKWDSFSYETSILGVSNIIQQISWKSENEIWICSLNAGIMVFNTNTKKFSVLSKRSIDPPGITTQFAYTTDSDISWFASEKGLSKLSPSFNKFQFKDFDVLSDDKRELYYATCIFNDSVSGKTFLGTSFGGGLHIFDNKKNTHFIYKIKTVPTERPWEIVGDIFKDSNGIIWVLTRDFVFQYNEKYDRLDEVKISDSGLRTPFFFNIYESSEGDIWITTLRKGIFYRRKNQKTFVNYNVTNSNLPDNYIPDIASDHFNRIWFATSTQGLSVYIPTADSFYNIKSSVSNPNSLAGNIITGISKSLDGNIWISTTTGLSRANLNKLGEFKNWYVKDGLISNYLLGVECDSSVWVLTYSGLQNLNVTQNKFELYNSLDGLFCNFGGKDSGLNLINDRNGKIYLAQKQGYYNLSQIWNAKPIQSNLIINSIQLFNKEKPVEIYVSDQNNITLNHDDNFIKFEFTALNYENPQKNNYAYKLSSFDKIWNNIGINRTATYTNIPPGKYEFSVSTLSNQGIVLQKSKTITITIESPFWQKLWFQLMIFATIVSGFYIIIRYRLFKFKQMEKLRWQIAGDLHDEIGGNLSSIALRTEFLIKSTDKLDLFEKAQFDNIINKARVMVNQIDDIIWSINPDNDKLEDMVFRMRDVASELLTNHDITFKFEIVNIDPAKRLKINIKKNLLLIFKEIINNIIKHSKATSATIKIGYENGFYKMYVEDNGLGFNELVSGSRHGIKNQKRRAKEIHAALEFWSEKNCGTKITITAKI